MSKRFGPKYRRSARPSERGRKTTSMQRQKLRAAARTFGSVGSRSSNATRRAVLNATTAGFLGIENKFYDTFLQAATIAAAVDATGGEYDPSITEMISTPPQGDGESERDGKRILINSVQVKGTITKPALEDSANPPGADAAYICLVLDTQSNGAQARSEDVFINPVNDAAGNTEPLRNLLFANRFRILKAEKISLDYPSVGVEGDNLHSAPALMRNFEWYIPFAEGLPVNFNGGGTNVIANVIDNSLHVMAFTRQGAALLSYNARIRFRG